MKSAEEWMAWPTGSNMAHKEGCNCILCQRHRMIQLDAYKQGMADAAKIAQNRDETKNVQVGQPDTDGSYLDIDFKTRDIVKAILTARDNKKEI